MKIRFLPAAMFMGLILLGGDVTAQAAPQKTQIASSTKMAYIHAIPESDPGYKANNRQGKLEKRTNEKLIQKLKQYFREQKRRKKQSIV